MSLETILSIPKGRWETDSCARDSLCRCGCVYVNSYCLQGDYVYGKYYTEVLFVEMHLNVVFVVLFVSAMGLTRVGDWRFIRTIIIKHIHTRVHAFGVQD